MFSCKLSPVYPESLTTKSVRQKTGMVTIYFLSEKWDVIMQCNLQQVVATVNGNRSFQTNHTIIFLTLNEKISLG